MFDSTEFDSNQKPIAVPQSSKETVSANIVTAPGFFDGAPWMPAKLTKTQKKLNAIPTANLFAHCNQTGCITDWDLGLAEKESKKKRMLFHQRISNKKKNSNNRIQFETRDDLSTIKTPPSPQMNWYEPPAVNVPIFDPAPSRIRRK